MADPCLRDLVRQFEAIVRDGVGLMAETGEETLNRRPGDNRWSVCECIEHLNVTLSLYLPLIWASIEEAGATGKRPAGNFRPGPVWRWVCRKLDAPYRMRIKAPGLFTVGRTVIPRDELKGRFEKLRGEMIDALNRAASVDLARTRVASPLSRRLSMKLGHCFMFLAAHERRHLWQARNTRDLVRARTTEGSNEGE